MPLLEAPSQQRVLIVEDDHDIAHLLVMALRERGYTVNQASAVDALDIAGAWHPHIVLIDMLMPRLGGADVCASLRALPQQTDMRIILMSALIRAAELTPWIGADAFLEKPFHLAQLYRVVQQTLGWPAPW